MQTEGQQNNISCLCHTNYNTVGMIKTSNADKSKTFFIHKKTF